VRGGGAYSPGPAIQYSTSPTATSYYQAASSPTTASYTYSGTTTSKQKINQETRKTAGKKPL